MKITNEFTVSAPAEKAWEVLTDLQQVVPLMPGAQLVGQEGDDYLGKVKVKVGPVTSEFSGKAHFVERDGQTHRGVVDARGREARGTGNAAATITFGVHEAGDRGMLQQVSEKLLGEFVDSLEAKLAAGDVEEDAARTAPTNGQVERPAPEPAPIDLIELAGGGAIKKYGPAVLVAIAVLLVFIVVSRRRH
jgi:carbon monoxide dehydrogenase subunit G